MAAMNTEFRRPDSREIFFINKKPMAYRPKRGLPHLE